MKFDRHILDKLVREKKLNVNQHQGGQLYIWNYSRNVQYNCDWDPITLQCRGLITDDTGHVISRPFPKFFNYEELIEVRLKGKVPEIPDLPYKVYKKLDGSLGILYWWQNHSNDAGTKGMPPYIATRGSFNSDQAVEANKILHTKYKNKFDKINKEWTYLFEIIYPENRIVVNYGTKRDIILLAVINTETGEEYDVSDPKINIGFEYVQEYSELANKGFRKLQKMNIDGEEGFVLVYENGFRLKVKFAEYQRLHKLLTNVTEKNIWENLMEGNSLTDVLESIPDESFNWIRETVDQFKKDYESTEQFAKAKYTELNTELYGIPFKKFRKQFATKIFEDKETTKISNVLFAMLDGKEYEKIIWKTLKP